MPGKLLVELQQTQPFSSLEEEAVLNLRRTADLMEREMSAVLKPYTLSSVQYNVLRILRGAGAEGAHCKKVGERMVTPEPDVTRLVDRLEQRGFVFRQRTEKDRRFVTVCITQEGLDLLASLDQPVREVSYKTLHRLGSEKLNTLIGLLEEIRV
ncbi:MAG: MarR family transcriptional regulator [Bryobacteraceae bacterium]|nr:MarR family transcriptional regulator [Bryobacteraceae bacterium]